MNDDILNDQLQRMQNFEQRSLRYYQGVVTTVSPLAVAVGGSTIPYTGVSALESYTAVVGDVVATVMFGNDMLVLGAIGVAEAWIAPTLLNSWANVAAGFAPAGYYKDSAGIVHLRGLVTGGLASTIFNLPAGYRPGLIEDYAQSQNSLFSQMRVRDNGDVQQATAAARTNQFIGYSFRAEN